MAKRRSAPARNVNRILGPQSSGIGLADWRLWDRDGALWTYRTRHHERAEIERLYDDPSVPVVVAENLGGLVWIDPADRRACWRDLERKTFPDETWERDWCMPFNTFELARGGRSLLLFEG